MKKFINLKIIKRSLYFIAILFVIVGWDKEPIQSIRLKLVSLFSNEAALFYEMRNLAINNRDNGFYYDYSLSSIDIEPCEVASDEYKLKEYIDLLSYYAQKDVYIAKKDLIFLSTYSTRDVKQDIKCPLAYRINSRAKSSLDRLLNEDFSNLLSWMGNKGYLSDLFDWNGRFDAFYMANVIEFYYRYGYPKLGRELVNDIINTGKEAKYTLDLVEKWLSNEYIISYDFIDALNYLIDKNSKYNYSYYKYKIAEAKLSKNKTDIESLKVIEELARKGNGHAILYLYNKNEIFRMPLNDRIRYLENTRSNYYDRSRKVLDKELAWLYKDIDPSSSLYYAEQACMNSDRFDCRELLAITYFNNKKYDKAREQYDTIFQWNNPSKYGDNEYGDNRYGVNASKRLGDIYYQGLGIRQDLKKAKEYYGIACDALNQDACTLYKEVNEKL